MLPKVILLTPPGDVLGGGLFHASSVVPYAAIIAGVIVDPMFNLELKSKEGKPASRDDVSRGLGIIRNSPTIKELAKKEPRWENDEEWLKIYSNPASIRSVLGGKR